MTDPSVVTPAGAAPVQETARISAIDTLRGFALLGILVMNIRAFSMVFAAYENPTVVEGLRDGINHWLWLGAEVFYDLKMMAIFSMLFGAGVVLMTSREEARSGKSARLHYTRMAWLLVIGLIHGYLIWAGDILFFYSLCGFIIWPLRKLRAKWLILIGVVLLSIGSLLMIGYGYWVNTSLEQINARRVEHSEATDATVDLDDEIAGDAADLITGNAGEEVTDPTDPADPVDTPLPPDANESTDLTDPAELAEGESEDELAAVEAQINKMRVMWSPPQDEIDKETAAYTGSLIDSITYRAPLMVMFHIFGFIFFILWRAGGLMLLGMGLFKLGVFSARCSKKTYAIMLVLGWGVGIPVILYGIQQNEQAGWTMEYSQTFGSQYNYWASLGIALGWVGLIMMICQAGALRWLTDALAAVGRMALTNYLMHSIVCTLIFYGHGLGYFGTFELWQQYLVVLGLWTAQLVLSPIWLSAFKFGPAEWMWRSLTYLKMQPMRR